MLTLISDEYKLQIFLFEKMGSRSIESAILGKVGLGGPEALTEIDNIDYDESITIKDIKGGFNITGGIFDYRKYEDRLSDQYYDDELDVEPDIIVEPDSEAVLDELCAEFLRCLLISENADSIFDLISDSELPEKPNSESSAKYL